MRIVSGCSMHWWRQERQDDEAVRGRHQGETLLIEHFAVRAFRRVGLTFCKEWCVCLHSWIARERFATPSTTPHC